MRRPKKQFSFAKCHNTPELLAPKLFLPGGGMHSFFVYYVVVLEVFDSGSDVPTQFLYEVCLFVGWLFSFYCL